MTEKLIWISVIVYAIAASITVLVLAARYGLL